jgi:hypothetical protein
MKRKAISNLLTQIILIGIIVGFMGTTIGLINYVTNDLLFNTRQFESFIIENIMFKTDQVNAIEVIIKNVGEVDVSINKVLINDEDVSSNMRPSKLNLKPKESGNIIIEYDWIPGYRYSIIVLSSRFGVMREIIIAPN